MRMQKIQPDFVTDSQDWRNSRMCATLTCKVSHLTMTKWKIISAVMAPQRMPRYLRAIQVPSGALISTQISIMIFFLSDGSGCQWHQHIEEASNIVVIQFLGNGSKMLPAGLLLVLKSFLGVVGRTSCVLYCTLDVGINSGRNSFECKFLIWM